MRPDDGFKADMTALEAAYLAADDPLVQSGFSGGPARWRAERAPLVEAIDSHGEFLDVGWANGLLAADVVRWTAARGREQTGVPLTGLIAAGQGICVPFGWSE